MNDEIENEKTQKSELAIAGPEAVKALPVSDITLAKRTPPHPIAKTVGAYLQALRNIAQTVQIVMPHLSKWLAGELTKTSAKIEKHIPDILEKGTKNVITLASARDFVELMSSLKYAEELRSNNATSVLTRSLFMQMFSEFDVFIGALLKAIYVKNDELLKGITREISLADLLEYDNIDTVKRAMLDKEIDTFRRESYVEQFTSLEKKFGLTLRKFPEWCEFVELGQRRNILTHNGGMVSDQYLVVCEREGCQFEKRPAIGDVLQVDFKYFTRALQLLSKVGFMLCHTLWGKVFPAESEELHNSINNALYDCLEQKRWRLASELGTFALSEPMKKGFQNYNSAYG
ncbi:MAG: hypothetical protein EXR27_03340 [Betaproteobacteria bacterium]|nr:hypothetical protein [Betaproteobacteria bacterium]